jgi:hypothetical protein
MLRTSTTRRIGRVPVIIALLALLAAATQCGATAGAGTTSSSGVVAAEATYAPAAASTLADCAEAAQEQFWDSTPHTASVGFDVDNLGRADNTCFSLILWAFAAKDVELSAETGILPTNIDVCQHVAAQFATPTNLPGGFAALCQAVRLTAAVINGLVPVERMRSSVWMVDGGAAFQVGINIEAVKLQGDRVLLPTAVANAQGVGVAPPGPDRF